MFSDTGVAIKVDGLSKCYHIYDTPRDRLSQMFSFGRKQYFREFWALKSASFIIRKGETVGVIGRNGSGKSTLLQMICGTVTPTSGVVRVNGRVAALLELGAGFNNEFTGRENILLNASILGFSREHMEERMAEVLAFSELGAFLDQPVKTYSSGMLARLGFSIAIHVDPDILIIDEALAVGDARFVAKCMRRIKEIQEKGATILFVSHDVGAVRTLCQRAIWMDKGKVVEEGDVFPVTGRYMAYMFKDEESEADKCRQEITKDLASAIVTTQDNKAASALSSNHTHGSACVDGALDARPVTHWGSHKGAIVGAAVCDESGKRQDVIQWGQPVEVIIDLSVPSDIPREHLSVAFSIKDLKGTDLIVSTTHDVSDQRLPEQQRFQVRFTWINPLVTGKYVLVAALENRIYADIHYYEYLEGAHYFASLSKERFFGIFQPFIQQLVLNKDSYGRK